MKSVVWDKSPAEATATTLVIGWGNELLGDDGVGRHVARAVMAWRNPAVAVEDVHQLAPELAALVADSARVIFVDAYVAEAGAGVLCSRLDPAQAAREGGHLSLGHVGSPATVLALAHRLYGVCPEAWLVAVPACAFEPWAALSATAERGVDDALAAIERLAGGKGESKERR